MELMVSVCRLAGVPYVLSLNNAVIKAELNYTIATSKYNYINTHSTV